MFNRVFLVCTKDRPEYLIEFLESNLIRSNLLPDSLVLIADGSDSKSTKEAISVLINKHANLALRYFSVNGGKPDGMNLLLKNLSNIKFIHCFDDDIKFRESYVRKSEEFLENYTEVVAVSPAIIDIANDGTQITKKQNILSRRFQGKLTSFGENYWVLQDANEILEVDWLPGGAFTMRNLGAKIPRYESNLVEYQLGGYALGEDLVFSLSLRSHGRLFCIASEKVFHYSSSSFGRNPELVAAADGRLKRYLIDMKLGNVVFIHVIMFKLLSQILSLRQFKFDLVRRNLAFWSTFLRRQKPDKSLE